MSRNEPIVRLLLVGKWCEVKCNCQNRTPVRGSQWLGYGDYQKFEEKPRLAKTPQEWEENVKGMYECGHRDGAFFQIWPGDIFKFGYALDAGFKDRPSQFEVFRRIADSRNYDDEYLALTPEEAALWELEIEQLKRFLSGEEFLGWHEKETFQEKFAESDMLYGDIESTLDDAVRLCKASALTHNSIEFMW